jgi:DNA-binding NarL/FixJ family response regulator
VDDNRSWVENYEEALSDQEYVTRSAFDLGSALSLLDRQFFHVAIVDVRLDDADKDNLQGLDVLQRIWELDEGTAAIVVSGFPMTDLLPSLMAYQVFDFVKREREPDAIAKQYRSAAFIKGVIDKLGSPAEALERVERASSAARRAHSKRKWLQSPFGFFRGLSSKDVQASLRGAGMVELWPFLGSLCRPLFPWTHSAQAAVRVFDRKDSQDCGVAAIENFAWSRALGKPVVVRFGPTSAFARSMDATPVGVSCNEARVGAEIAHQRSDHFEGKAWAVDGVSFDKAFSPPPVKRVSRGRGKLS